MTPLLTHADVVSAVERILIAYMDMLDMPANAEEAKALAAHQAACRAVLAHIEHLLKVAKLLGSKDEAPDLRGLIAEADAAVGQGGPADAADTSA